MRYRRLNVRVPSKNVTIAAGYDEVLRATGYRRNLLKTALFHIIAVVSLGIPYFVVYWFDFLSIPLQYSICEVKKAEVLLLKDVHGQKYISKVQFQEAKPGFPVDFCLNSSGSHTEPTTPTDNTCLWAKKQIKFFIHKKWKYIWRPEIEAFRLLSGIDNDSTLIDFHDKFQGYSSEVQSSKLLLYGPNTVNVSIKSYLRLLLEEVLNPFYVFEAFSIAVWTVDKYIYYAYVIIIVTVISIAAELYETRKQSIALREMVSSQCSRVQIVRPHGIEEEDASCLVPGDVITIPVEGILMPCDAVVISGNCIVDESMLTGESYPETKTPLPYVDELYDPDVHKRHTLFCGTRVLQVRHYGANQVTAVVVRTGFNTARGELVRAILHPKPVGFHFYKDAMKFMGLMAIVSVFGMIYAIYIYIEKKAPLDEIIIRALDIITIVVPPAMPAAMTVGTVYSQTRLRKQGIFCISPLRINIAGKIKLVCFDKTGTLTESGLDFWGVVPRRGLVLGPLVQETALLAPKDPLLVALATCHTLSCVQGQLTGAPLDVKMFQATGWILEEMACDPSRTDLLMTPAVVKPSIDDCESMNSIEMSQTNFLIPYEVGILRQFPFSSKLQRMSVIVRTLGSSHMELYCKGSPEKLRALCDPATATMERSLLSYTCKGFRVLALAHRKLESKLSWHNMHRLKREQAERDMTFLGFLVMHNCLKPETVSVIEKLEKANIRTVMLTGDNLLTAASIGRECGMISPDHKLIQVTALPPLADNPASIHYTYMPGTFHAYGSQSQSFNESDNPVMSSTELENNKQLVINVEPPLRGPYSLVMSGRTWSIVRVHFPEMTQRLLLKGTIFARLSPDQKAQIVEELQEMGYTVAMVGDGCNDCGALKAADVGVSLSEAEASVAAPFTSKGGNIACVPLLIQEGRCALVTSFGVFKYMALYSLIQFISVLILYSRHTTLGDMMFLYHDLLITTSVAVLMTKTGPYPELVARRPRGSLLSTANLFSVGLQIMITFTLQLAALLLVMTQPWFRPIQPIDDELIIQCWETTSVFIISSFQYLILSVAFSYGPPFRQPFYTNVPFILTLLALAGFTLVLGIYPVESLASFFEVVGMDDYENMFHVWIARVGLIFLVSLNGALALFVEYLCGDSQWFRQLLDKAQGKTKSKHAYKELEKSLQKEDWPPITTYGQSLVEQT